MKKLLAIALLLAAASTATAQRIAPGGGSTPPADAAGQLSGMLYVQSFADDGSPMWAPIVWLVPIDRSGQMGTPVVLMFANPDTFSLAVHSSGRMARVTGAFDPESIRFMVVILTVY